MTEKQKIFSGPLSQRARKILRSLYGLEPHLSSDDQRNIEDDQPSWSKHFSQEKKEPILGGDSNPYIDKNLRNVSLHRGSLNENTRSENFIAPIETSSSFLISLLNTLGVIRHKKFAKSRYIKESKGTYLYDLILAISIFVMLIVLVFASDFSLLRSEVGSIKSRVGNIQDIKNKIISVNSTIEFEKDSLLTKKQAYSELHKLVYDQNSIKDLVTKFLAELEGNRVSVKISLARFSNTPVFEAKNSQRTPATTKDLPSGADRLKELARIVSNKEPIANQAVQDPKNKPDPGKTLNAADTTQGHSLPEDADLTIPYDANRPGIGYYYIKLELSGAYISYLAVRQQLINLVPGAIIESEKVTSQNNKSTVTILVGINLPFYQEKN